MQLRREGTDASHPIPKFLTNNTAAFNTPVATDVVAAGIVIFGRGTREIVIMTVLEYGERVARSIRIRARTIIAIRILCAP